MPTVAIASAILYFETANESCFAKEILLRTMSLENDLQLVLTPILVPCEWSKGERLSIFSKPSLKPYSSNYTLIAVIVLDEIVTQCYTKTANHFTIDDKLFFLQVV